MSNAHLRGLSVRDVAHIDALAGVHRDLRHGDLERVGNVDCTDAMIMNRQVLLPYPVDLLGLMDFNVLDERSLLSRINKWKPSLAHPGEGIRQLYGTTGVDGNRRRDGARLPGGGDPPRL